MIRIEFLFTGNFELDGQVFRFEKGAVVWANEEVAKRLIDGKCAVLYKEKKVKYERKN